MMTVSKAFSQYAKFMLAYGVGARTLEGNGSAVDICAMTGDFLDPFVESQAELLNCYEGTLRTVKIAGPVNYQAIVKFVCDLAQLDFGTASDPTQIRNYYVLTILMAGLIDDIDQSVNQILRAAELPISVQIVKIGGVSESENDFGTLIERTRGAFEQCERKFIDMHDFNNYKVRDKTSGSGLVHEERLQLDLMRNVPSQIEKFFEIQHFDFDNSNNLLNSPEPKNMSSSDSSSQHQAAADCLGNEGYHQLSPTSPIPDKGDYQRLTADNLAKRDSLMMLDAEANRSLRQEIQEQSINNFAEEEHHLMQAARLKQINLELESGGEERKFSINADCAEQPPCDKMIGQVDYKKKILLFLEMEKLKLVNKAVAAGISEATVLQIFDEESLIDFSLEQLQAVIKDRLSKTQTAH